MLSQTAANGALVTGGVVALLLSIGLFLNSRGILRARYFMGVWQPVSLVAGGLAYFAVDPLLPNWGIRIVVSIIGAVLITAGTWIILAIAKVDIDQWDQRKRKS
jgi:hypothetical protein